MDGNRFGAPARILLGTCAIVIACGASAAEPKILDAGEILKQIETAPPVAGAAPVTPPGVQLINDIIAFRTQAITMAPEKAATTWFDLYDRARALTLVQWSSDYRLYDPDLRSSVTGASVLYSLPPPAAWPALRNLAESRASRAPTDTHAIAARLMTELLLKDRAAAEGSLEQVEALAARRAPEERAELLAPVTAARATLAELYGTPEEIATTFVSQQTSVLSEEESFYARVEVPDLVGLVGETRAAAMLEALLTSPTYFESVSGDATRALARKVALAHIAEMRTPQWALAESIDGAALYEAMQRRFDVQVGGNAATPAGAMAKFTREGADTYYFLAMVIKGNQSAAATTLQRMARDEQFDLPKDAVVALQKAGQQEALFQFLHQTLQKQPELRAWDVYIEQAAYTGHANEALALIDALLARQDLPEFVQTDVRKHRIDALLARDDVEPATRALRELLKPAPTKSEGDLEGRITAAVRLAGIGRVLSKPALSNAALDFLHQVLKLPAAAKGTLGDAGDDAAQRSKVIQAVLAEQRKLGRVAAAQADAVAELRVGGGERNQYERFGIEAPSSTQSLAMADLVALYGSSGRNQDVLRLLDESTKWGARDLEALAVSQDSVGEPLFLIAARALAESGNKTAALSLLQALLASRPGYDPAYELLVHIDPNALQTLEALYREDAFEERPLIWSALLLKNQGQLDAALTTIKRALAIDPSDGEEGKNDRMRGYAVLADILEAQGDKKAAAEYRGAVAAIRISESSDELHELGLYKRAFAGYREALTHFQDAYCIQSRLAVQLSQQGQRSEALEHYRRAYELMPASFGRVESHCFGCESVFQGEEQQSIADEVFTRIVAKSPDSPPAHYLLGYLREEQSRPADALQRYREAVALDKDYLNAWKHLNGLGDHVYIEPFERDIARMRLLELDPRQRHVHYELNKLGDPAALWRAVEKVSRQRPLPSVGRYPLRASAKFYDDTVAKLPEEFRGQVALYQAAAAEARAGLGIPSSRAAVATHVLIAHAAMLMGLEPEPSY